jgi:tetratricopeptide (TPR) repeat protein
LKLLPILIIASSALVAVLFTIGFLDRVERVRIPQLLRPSRQPALRELSNEGRYAEVLNWSAEVLADKPLDSEALLFRGIAHFYLALTNNAASGLDLAIAALRRARLDADLRYWNESAYLLGKAYYHKGGYYYDAAIRYLTESLQDGQEPPDVREYLGMAYVRTGDLDTGMEHFATALQRQPNALLYLSVGQLLARLSRPDEALEHFHAAVEAAADQAVEVRARLMLGKVLLEHGGFVAARDQFQEILEIAPGSADASVFLGDAYAGLGDVVQARAQWRRARSMDAQHHGANLRLRG